MDGLTHALRPRPSRRSAETLLVAFLATVVMLFAGFTSAFLIRRTGSDWQPVALPGLAYANTLVLVAASVLLELARRRASPAATRAALVCGLVFLGGQVGVWRLLDARGLFLSDTPEGAFFFLLSAVHGVHLLGGVVALLWQIVQARTPRLVAAYWHFLGLVWLYVLLLLHLQ
jgi:cytochrome c oxidase subunit 3